MEAWMKVAVVFGQFGAAADPVNLPAFEQRIQQAGHETILVQHTDTQKVYDFKPDAIVGASLGAGVAPIMAGYLQPRKIRFVGGFQPSDYDPVMHDVAIQDGDDLITRAVTVPANVQEALCFRNPIIAITGGLGHAAYVAADPKRTRLITLQRPDIHPGDFGEAQDIMVQRVLEALK